MRLLDLFAGAGGCSVGYHRAGFDVTGIDIEPHADYPFEFHQLDATALRFDRLNGCIHEYGPASSLPGRSNVCLGRFDVIHASPPCPRYSTITPDPEKHPDLLTPIRELLREGAEKWGVLYVIENVPGAPLDHPVTYCGSAFGLGVRRHRLFESNVPLMSPGCAHGLQPEVWGVYGDHGDAKPVTRPNGTSRGNKARDVAHAQQVMDIDWMTRWDDLADAIPPAYTEHIGGQLMAHLQEVAA